MIGIIIPYGHTNERLPLLKKSLEYLPWKHKEIRLFIHEMGINKNVPDLLNSLNIDAEYIFTKTDKGFRKAWAVNYMFREKIENNPSINKIVIFDADIVVDNKWINQIIRCGYPASAWNKIYFLDNRFTQDLIYDEVDPLFYNYFPFFRNFKKLTASHMRQSGGIVVLPKIIFSMVKGIPEDFDLTWGAEDSAFWYKLLAITGMSYKSLNSTIFHLYHKCRQKFDGKIYYRIHFFKNWDQSKWIERLNHIGEKWGIEKEFTRKVEIVDRYEMSRVMADWRSKIKKIEKSEDIIKLSRVNDFCEEK